MEWPYSRRCDASSPKGQSERHFNSKQTTTLAHLSYCSLPVVSLFLFLFVVGRVCTSTFPLPAVPSEKLLILRQHHTSGPLRASFFFFCGVPSVNSFPVSQPGTQTHKRKRKCVCVIIMGDIPDNLQRLAVFSNHKPEDLTFRLEIQVGCTRGERSSNNLQGDA